MKRKFFDWDRPFLPAVAEYVVRTALEGRTEPAELDLSQYVFVLSGSRAKRTLEAYIQREVEAALDAGKILPNWLPPDYETIGNLPERLYVSHIPAADRLTRLYCMRKTVEEFFAKKTPESEVLLPTGAGNFDSQLTLADTFLKLKDDLESERSAYRFIAEKCREIGLPEEAERWNALELLDKRYYDKLSENRLTELNRARSFAIDSDRIGGTPRDQANGVPREYRVIGGVDLNKLQKDVFRALGDRVEFWVFAPENEGERFDEFGCVIPDQWEKYELPLKDEQLYQVDSPAEQGEAVALLTRELSKRFEGGDWTYEPIEPTSLTVGAPSDEATPFIEQRLREIGYETIVGEGTPIVKNRVYRLLVNVAEYLEKRSFSSFSELLRRPDLEKYIKGRWGLPEYRTIDRDDAREVEPTDDSEQFDDLGAEDAEAIDGAQTPESETKYAGDWLSDLDDYRSRYLPTRVDGRWFQFVDPDNEKRNRSFVNLRKAYRILNDALKEFWADPTGKECFARSNVVVTEESGNVADLKIDRGEIDKVLSGEFAFIKDAFNETVRWTSKQQNLPLNEWAFRLSQFLSRIYDAKGKWSASEEDRESQAQIDGFFKQFNNALNSLHNVPKSLAEETSGSEAIRVLLKQLASARIEPAPGTDLVEIQGALDLLFDDAPNLILTGFNEGVLPSAKSSDLFLPNSMRAQVGLSDAKRVFARDVYLVAALLHSRRNMFVVFGKHSLQGDPLLPSRFVFAADLDAIPDRVVQFFGDGGLKKFKELRLRQLDASGQTRNFPRAVSSAAAIGEEGVSEDDELAALNAKADDAWNALEERQKFQFKVPTLDLQAQYEKQKLRKKEENASRFDLNCMNVTDFETFLSSPYLFFLKKLFNVYPAPDPRTFELDAAKFGTFVHDVLREFGTSEIKDSTDPHVIGGWLSARLDKLAANFVNEHTSPFVKIQIEQIRGRLWAFARWQAEWRKTGAEIRFVEKGPKDGWIDFRAGDRTVKIVGRVDRIDFNPKTRRWYVFDYKTYDSAKEGKEAKGDEATLEEPIKAEDGQTVLYSANVGNQIDVKHRVKPQEFEPLPQYLLGKMGINLEPRPDRKDERRWINLQTPLYRRILWQILCEERGLEPTQEALDAVRDNTQVSLAYVVLPKSGVVRAYGGPWDERDLEEADAAARWTIQTIRSLWGVIRPETSIDPTEPALGQVLEVGKLKFAEDYAPITLSYLADK